MAGPIQIVEVVAQGNIGRDSMVGEGNESAFFNQRCKTVDLGVDLVGGAGQDMLVESSDHKEVPAVLLAPGNRIGAPGADLDREHAVDAGVQPMGEEGIDFSVAIDPDQVNPVLVQQLLGSHPDEPETIIEQLYIRTLTRKPTATELKVILADYPEKADPKALKNFYDGVLWGLLNSSEFVFNH